MSNVVHASVLKVWCDLLCVFVMISKRSNFITRLAADKKHSLIMRLLYLAEVFNYVIFSSNSAAAFEFLFNWSVFRSYLRLTWLNI